MAARSKLPTITPAQYDSFPLIWTINYIGFSMIAPIMIFFLCLYSEVRLLLTILLIFYTACAFGVYHYYYPESKPIDNVSDLYKVHVYDPTTYDQIP